MAFQGNGPLKTEQNRDSKIINILPSICYKPIAVRENVIILIFFPLTSSVKPQTGFCIDAIFFQPEGVSCLIVRYSQLRMWDVCSSSGGTRGSRV